MAMISAKRGELYQRVDSPLSGEGASLVLKVATTTLTEL